MNTITDYSQSNPLHFDLKNLEMEHFITDKHAARMQNKNESKKKDLYAPILRKIKYWRDYTGTGDLYRQQNDLDCILTNGNLNADAIFSLWLPLRYVLNHFGYVAWETWKEYEYEELKPKKMGLKDCPAFLNELIANIEGYLPPTGLTTLLSELFQLGQQRCNVMILPYRSWNSRRGCRPYWDYLPHFIYDLMNTDSPLFLQALQTWIKSENLEMFFINGRLDKEYLKDLAGTGAIWKHAPENINVEELLINYIAILKERKLIISTVA